MNLFSSLSTIMSFDPALRVAQAMLVVLAAILLFFLFFALKDITKRTKNFWYQFACIVLVAVLPIVGFLIYLLIRPSQTLKQRKIEDMILSLYENSKESSTPNPSPIPSSQS